MSDKKLAILGLTAVVMVILAVVQSNISNKPAGESNVKRQLIQGINPADIASIEIGTGDDAVKLVRGTNGFSVINKEGYEADLGALNTLITACLDVEVGEMVTDNAANNKDLGVTEEDASAIVKFFRDDSSMITGIAVGKKKEQSKETYVRLLSDSENKVYLASEAPKIKTDAIDYCDKDLFELNPSDIEQVTVSSPNDVYTLRTGASGTVVMDDMEAGRTLKVEDAKEVLEALSSLSFSDVNRQTDVGRRHIFTRKYECKLKDSTVYTLNISDEDGDVYVTCRADFYSNAIPNAMMQNITPEQGRLLEKQAAARQFTANHAGWVYRIGTFESKKLVKVLSGLLEDQTPPASIIDANTPVDANTTVDANMPVSE